MVKLFNNKHLPFWLVTIATLVTLPGVTLIQDGMFMDAMLYTSVAHNEAHDYGTFWFPKFSELNVAFHPFGSFHEQPPLVFFIVSLFFRAFGDSMYVERLYVFVTTLLVAWLICRIWKAVFEENGNLKKFAWLPVLLWMITPTIFWAASNNVNENTMAVFATASVWVMYKALRRQRRVAASLLLAGALIFLASMSKGFPGLFPLGVPIIFWCSFGGISFPKAVGYTALLFVAVAACYGLCLLYQPARESLHVYLFDRAFQRIGNAPTARYRLQSIESVVTDLLPVALLTLAVWLVCRRKKIVYRAESTKGTILFFCLVGLSASMPLMLTMVQKPFYLIPCFPYFAIAFGIAIAGFVARPVARINVRGKGFRTFVLTSMLLLAGGVSVVASLKGRVGRDEGLLHDVAVLGTFVPEHSTVGVTYSAYYNDWQLQCYLMRYHYISVNYKPERKVQYFIIDKKEPPDRDLSRFRKLDKGLVQYDVYVYEE
ncbi:MAG: glycosyltransferase family 39 protein [Edaphocola sp.]